MESINDAKNYLELDRLIPVEWIKKIIDTNIKEYVRHHFHFQFSPHMLLMSSRDRPLKVSESFQPISYHIKLGECPLPEQF